MNKFIRPLKSGVVIYTIPDCQYCYSAMKILADDMPCKVNCKPYLEDNREEFLEFMMGLTAIDYKINNKITFPIIFFGNKYIGGYSELVDILKKEIF
jgi:glutaredoxin